MMHNFGNRCAACKGTRMLCGRPSCPLLAQMRAYDSFKALDRSLDGESPSVFVGHYGYPNVFIGPLSTPGADSRRMVLPETWFGKSIDDVIEFRSKLVRGKEKAPVDSAKAPDRNISDLQEIAMSIKPPDSETEYKKKPNYELSFSKFTEPYGPSGIVDKFRITSNPKIPHSVDSVVNDELKSYEQIDLLYRKGSPVSDISRILSIGLLGMDKKFVPTRWSITATDDTLGKKIIREIKDYPELGDITLLRSSYLDNHFNIMMYPGKWSFDMIEVVPPSSMFSGGRISMTADFEPYNGRKKYASEVAGGYYAARLAVLEYLKHIRRQASVLIVREIREGYYAPLGVWQVRENVRNAMLSDPEKYQSLGEALQSIDNAMITKDAWRERSRLVPLLRSREAMRKWIA